jgi:hypothetical protein
VVGHRQQRVGVGRQVDADDLGLLVDHVVDEARVLVAEAVVVLPPDVRGEQVVQRGDRRRHGYLAGHLQPLGVLVEHRIDDVDERLVAREEPVAPGQQVAFEPALALVLAEHFHHPAVRREMVVAGHDLRGRTAVGHLEHGVPAVRVGLVGAEHAEVVGVALHHVADELPCTRVASASPRPARHRDGIVAEVRHPQVAQQQAAVGVRVGAHAALAFGRQLGQFRLRAGPVASNSSSGR